MIKKAIFILLLLKKRLILFLALLMGVMAISGFAFGEKLSRVPKSGGHPSQTNKRIKNRLNDLIKKSSIKSKKLGLIVHRWTGTQSVPIFELNSSELFSPASLTKIATAGLAIKRFPLNFQFKTRLMSMAPVKKGVLKGDLYLVGGGDPGFVSESMWRLVNEFVRTGVHTIEGDLIIDDSRFDRNRFDPDRIGHRVDRAYDAPVGAMSFNWNSVNIYVRPGQTKGSSAVVYADPKSSYIKVMNQAKTVSSGNRLSIRVSRLRSNSSNKVNDRQNVIVVKGGIPLGYGEKVFYKNISHPSFWSGFQLKEFLSRRGIQVKGIVKLGELGKQKPSHLLAEFKGKYFYQVLADMMKFSNNFVAEMIIKNIPAEFSGVQGTMDRGVKMLNEYLDSLGTKKYVLKNVSGLSRANRFSPEALHKVLVQVKKNFLYYPEFVVSLPRGGVDGTLKRRFTQDGIKGLIRAKTGTLNGVVGLAGFAGASEGLLSFVYIFNGHNRDMPKAKNLLDQLAVTLL